VDVQLHGLRGTLSRLDLEALRRRLAELISREEAPLPRRTAWWEPAREWLRK
jgi:hypothetical protein